jgi:predicted Zn-dependent protease
VAELKRPLLFLALVIALVAVLLPRVWLPDRTRVKIGREASEHLLRTWPESKDVHWKRHVERIGKRIAAVSERPADAYRFFVLESDKVNAYATPDGSVFITTKLLEGIGADEEALASVLAHEIGHIARRHGSEHIQSALGWKTLTFLVFGISRPLMHGAANLAANIVDNGYGRALELEADLCAVRYMARLGYPPSAGIAALKMFPYELGSPDGSFAKYLRSHPATKERIEYSRGYIDRHYSN